jgi:hypothetical protein
MKTTALAFNAADLIGSVEAFARHLTGKQKLTLRTATMPHRREPMTDQSHGVAVDAPVITK